MPRARSVGQALGGCGQRDRVRRSCRQALNGTWRRRVAPPLTGAIVRISSSKCRWSRRVPPSRVCSRNGGGRAAAVRNSLTEPSAALTGRVETPASSVGGGAHAPADRSGPRAAPNPVTLERSRSAGTFPREPAGWCRAGCTRGRPITGGPLTTPEGNCRLLHPNDLGRCGAGMVWDLGCARKPREQAYGAT